MPDFTYAPTETGELPALALVVDDKAAERILERLEQERRELQRLNLLHDDELARLTARHEEVAAPRRREIALLEESLAAYVATAYPGRKTIPFMHGTVRYRTTRDRIEVTNGEAFSSWARQHGGHLARVKYEPDKPAIQQHITDTGEQSPGVVLVPGQTRAYVETEVL